MRCYSESQGAPVPIAAARPIQPSSLRAGQYEIISIIARLNVGGPALHVIQVTAGLNSRYSTLLIAGDVDETEVDMQREAQQAGVALLRLPGLGRRVRPAQDLWALFRLFRILRRVRPRIVHTHTAKAGALGRLAAWLARVPVRVHTYHGHVLHGYFSRRTSRLLIAIERILGRLSTRIIALSPSQGHELVRQYRVCSSQQLAVVPLGFELQPFRGVEPGAAQSFRSELEVGSARVITMVGRLVPIKHHQLLVAAAGRLLAQRRNYVFVIVGGGPEEARIREQVESLGLAAHFRFCGWRRDLPRIYAGSDLIVLTSHNEGTPVCLMEALAAARPVVATAVGGVPDLLEHGRLGVLVPPGNERALATAMADLLDHPARAAKLAQRGATVILERFSIERQVRELIALYESLRPDLVHRPVTVSAAEKRT
jgi:glycosyltransferase involved in cell wall biosynthesis